MNEKISQNDDQLRKAITARLDKYGFLKFMDEIFANAYEKEGKKQLDIREYNLLCHTGYPCIGGKKPTIKRIDGEIACTDYPGILKSHPELKKIYEDCEKL